MAANAFDVVTVRETGTVGDIHTTQTSMDVRWVHVSYTSDATAGNRNLLFTFRNRAGVTLYDVRSGANQGASSTRHYNFVKGCHRETGFQGGGTEMLIPLPHLFIEAGYQMLITDENAVSAADTYVLSFQADQ